MKASAKSSGGILASAARLWRSFVRSRSGNVATMFGLTLIPLVTAAGAALDMSRAMVVRSRLMNALDATGLAIGGAVGVTPDQMREMAERYFEANYPASEIGVPSDLRILVVENRVQLEADAKLDTTLMHLIGINYLDVSARVEVTRESKGLEVVLVLDTTGSMANLGRIQALRAGAKDMIEILFGGVETPELLRMGIVPFSQSVRLDPTQAVTSGWIDTTGQAQFARTNFDTSVTDNFAFRIYQMMSGTPWRGCVEARPNRLDETDTPPTIVNPDTRWVPYFAPDEPNNNSPHWSGYPNSYVSDGISGTNALNRQRRSSKYVNRTANGTRSPHRGCDMQPITPLINTRSTLISRIDALNPSGWTHVAYGLGWGWRVLSPGEPFSEGQPYDEPRNVKALVVMTDGDNTMPPPSGTNNINGSEYTAYGYAAQARLGPGIDTVNEIEAEQNASTARICQAIKDAGIRVYSITLSVSNNTTRNLFRNCASEPKLYFESPTAAELRPVFQNIAQDLSNLRLSQ